jgi:hypothetical protein
MASTITAPTATYANTTISSAGLSSGSGLTYTTGTSISDGTWSNRSSGVIHAKDFVIDGELSLREVLEQRLNMLVPNPEMEKEWAELKQLGNAYRKLEAECVEKSKMWKTLKKK